MPAVVNEIEPCTFNALGDFAHNLGWRQRILATTGPYRTHYPIQWI